MIIILGEENPIEAGNGKVRIRRPLVGKTPSQVMGKTACMVLSLVRNLHCS